MAVVKGYKLLEKVLVKGNKTFYLAKLELDDKKVFLKVLESQDFDSPEVAVLKREYEISKNLEHPSIVKALGFIEFHGGAAMVMDEFDGVSLQQFIANKKVPFREFLLLSINLCDGLGYLQTNGIIHKDLKPANILVNPKTLDIKIIDFGIASLIPQEDILPENITVLEGTLTYISPEQSGRMNRPLDYRSDLYSLGITLYEILTGKPPFTSIDSMELVHAHMAIKPVSPAEIVAELPLVISPIILKLLEKSPENRYKSATGLKTDLQTCLQSLDNTGVIPNFEIAQKDFSDKLSISQKIYGREEELALLMNSFKLAGSGLSQVLFVSGSPGIGKSVLINEISRPVVAQNSFFIKGKFDQFNRNIPYSAILDAFQELVDFILVNNQELISQWKTKILNEVGENAQLLVDVLPSLELIIGTQPKVAQLPAAEALNRFNLVFQGFVRAFASGPSALVLFFDDLQWADQASLQLLEFLMADKDKKHLLVICSYRDNEVSASHPLHRIIEEAAAKTNVNRIHLGAIKPRDLKQLLADTFNCSPELTNELTELIDKKTKRNPFFISEFIKTLYKKGLVFFDYQEHKWKWSIGQIEESNITENVIELVTELLLGLEKDTRNLCALAACIGNQFDLRTLAVVNQKDAEGTAQQLWQAIKEGVIVPLTENYKSVSNNPALAEKITYKFLHDRVQQAAYNTILEKDRAEIHLAIGRLLQSDESEKRNDAKIFDVVNHLNKGESLVTDAAEKMALANLNFEAGKKAKSASAFEPAFEYFNTAVGLLPKNAWAKHYQQALQFYNEAAETAYLAVRTDDFEKYTQAIFKNASSTLDTLNAYIVKIAFYGSQGKHDKSLETSFEILAKLGVKLPHKPNQLHVVSALIGTKIRLRGKSVDDLFNLPQMESENWKAAMSVLSIVTGPAYIANTNLFVLIVFKMIELSIKYGNNRFTSFGYAVLGMVLSGMMDLEGVKTYTELSRKLLNAYPEDEQYCKVNYCITTLNFLHHPIQNAQSLMYKNIQKGFDSGDFLYASYSVFYYTSLKFYGNYRLPELLVEVEPHCQKLDSLNQKVGLGWTNSFMQLMSNLTNETEVNTTLSGRYFNEAEMLPLMTDSKNVSGIALMYVLKACNSFLFDQYADAIGSFKKVTKTLDSLVGTPMVNAFHFYNALAHLALYKKASFTERLATKRLVNKSIALYQKWAATSAENNAARLEILLGAKAYMASNNQVAKKHLKTALELTEKYQLIQEKGLANELLAKLAFELNEQMAFNEYIFEARFCYHQWGAVAKVLQLEQKYKLQHVASHLRANEKHHHPDVATLSTDSLDLQTVIKASQALSSEVQLEGLFKKMINIVMENAGATGCTIVLKQDAEWVQEISKKINSENKQLNLERIAVTEANQDKLDLPISIANYVIRTKKSVSINNPKTQPAYAADAYLAKHNPQSVLCFPFSSKGDDLGVIYLENNLATDAFSNDRIRLLSIVSSQLAISIENAFLYKNLEQKVEARTADLVEKNNELELEKKKSDKLLLNILPGEIAEELKEKGSAKARMHPAATVLFADVKGFTSIAEGLQPEDLVTMLHSYFSRFDEISTKYNLEKIKTIGDAYMAVGGVPNSNKVSPADVVRAAQEMIDAAKDFQSDYLAKNQNYFEIRIGIHTGPVVSGIVGKSKFQFDIWGDTVNVAARLEQNSLPGRINVSRATHDEIKDHFTCHSRGMVPIKNRGEVEMFFVDM